MNKIKASNALFIFTSLIIISVAIWARNYFLQVEKKYLHSILTTYVSTANKQLEDLLKNEIKQNRIWATQKQVIELAKELNSLKPEKEILVRSNAQKKIRNILNPVIKLLGHQGFFIISKNYLNLASTRDQNIAMKNLLSQEFLDDILQGKARIALPQESDVLLEKQNHKKITMFSASPIKDEKGDIIGIFTFRLNPDNFFNNLLKHIRFGQTGESYAFDKKAYMLSENPLRNLIKSSPFFSKKDLSYQNIRVHNPGKKITPFKIQKMFSEKFPLTEMAKSALRGNSSANLDGYLNYQGIEVVGAWKWIKGYEIGIATEISKEEAFKIFHLVEKLILLLTLVTVVLLIVSTALFKKTHSKMLLTEQMLEDKVKERTHELELANKSKDLFLRNMSHELRTPLNAILGFSELIEMDPSVNSITKNKVKKISSAGKHLLALVEDVLLLSRLNSQEAKATFTVCNVQNAIEDAILFLEDTAKKQDIFIETNLREINPNLSVFADKMNLHQILLNLIGNALKYAYKDTITKILVTDEIDRVKFTISDRGAGITENDKKLLFKPFERGRMQNSGVEGTGIGLVICKKMLDSMNGTIGFDSIEEVGSNFYFTLPKA